MPGERVRLRGPRVRARERASEGLGAPARGLRAPGRGEGACARGAESRQPPGFHVGARRARKVGVRLGRWGAGAAGGFGDPGAGWRARSRDPFLLGAPPSRTPGLGRRGRAADRAAPPTPSALCRGAAGVAPRPAAPSGWGLRDEQRLDTGERRRRGPAPAWAARRSAGRTQAAAKGSTPPALLCPRAQPTPSRRPGSAGDEPRELRAVGALAAAAAAGERTEAMFWCSWISNRAGANAFPRAGEGPGSRIVGGFFTGRDWRNRT